MIAMLCHAMPCSKRNDIQRDHSVIVMTLGAMMSFFWATASLGQPEVGCLGYPISVGLTFHFQRLSMFRTLGGVHLIVPPNVVVEQRLGLNLASCGQSKCCQCDKRLRPESKQNDTELTCKSLHFGIMFLVVVI